MEKALFGGTFDPVHIGHVKITEKLRDAFGLDEVLIVPAAVPPHKMGEHVTDSPHRLKMAQLAFENVAGATVCDVEVRRGGTSYTIDTIKLLLGSFPKGATLYLIIGLDSFLEIHTWKSYMEIFRLVPVIVYPRKTPPKKCRALFESQLASKVSDKYRFSAQCSCYVAPSFEPVYRYEGETIDISSTQIRQKLKAGKPITGLVPRQVEKYIFEKGLYK